MKKITRQNLIDEYFNLVINGEPKKVDDLLFKAVEEKKVNSGALLVYGMSRTHGYEKISDRFNHQVNKPYHHRFTTWELNYYIKDIKDNAKKTLEFLKEHGVEVITLE